MSNNEGSEKKRKVKKVLGVVFTCIAALFLSFVIVAGLILCSIFGVFGPEDLGVEYTRKDTRSVMRKLNISFEDDADEEMIKDGDCTIKIRGRTMRKESFSSEELTAFANTFFSDMAEQQQILIKDDEIVVYSGQVYLDEFLEFAKIDPDSLNLGGLEVEKVNLLMEAELVVEDGNLALDVESISVGVVEKLASKIMEEVLDGDCIKLPLETESLRTRDDSITITAALPDEMVVVEN